MIEKIAIGLISVLPQHLHILALHILEVCTPCLSQSLFVPNLFVLQFILTRPCLYQTLNYLYLNFTWHKCALPHIYQTLMYSIMNIPNLFIPNVFATLGPILKSQLSWRSEKSQLARWGHGVALLSEQTTHPPTRPPTRS